MNRRARLYAIGWPLGIAAIALASCGLFGGNSESPATGTSAVSSPPAASSTVPTVMPSVPPTAAEQAGLDYLRSPQRIQRYEKVWPAAEKVAKAILAGKFGKFHTYNESKEPRSAGYTGWGGMQTEDRKTYAWVWWNADGSVDYSKGVTGFSLYGLNLESAAGNTPYRASIPKVGYVVVTATGYFGSTSPIQPYSYPVTVLEAQAFDGEALRLLGSNLVKAGLA